MSAVAVRTPDSGFESLEERYETLSRFIPYLLLAVPLVPYVLSQSPTAGALGITVARPGRRARETSGSGWPGRSTTLSPRA